MHHMLSTNMYENPQPIYEIQFVQSNGMIAINLFSRRHNQTDAHAGSWSECIKLNKVYETGDNWE
jgi:hypothetical protein